jgi:GNAT superfamily N-acetyltransferase
MTTMTMNTALPRPSLGGIDGIEIREAVAADDEALLALTKATPMAGKISLRIDRDPDFFALPRARGKTVVFVATCQGNVVGCMSASIHLAYVDGVAETMAHANDLKVHPLFTGKRLALRLIAAIEDYLRIRGIDLSFNLVADGNERVMALAEGRHGTPVQVMLGRFFVDQLLPSPIRQRSGRYRVEEARVEDLPEIAEILDRSNRERLFAPPVTVAGLQENIASAASGSFRKMIVARDARRVVATLTIEDTQHLRQNVLIGLPASLRFALGVLRVFALAVPGLTLPRIGKPLAALYVRSMACVPGHETALQWLIAEARVETFREKFTFLSVGLHERDPLRFVVAGIPRFTFTSRAMATSLITPNRVKSLVDQVPYEDFALV